MGNDALYRSLKGITIQYGTWIAHDVERWHDGVGREQTKKNGEKFVN